MGTSIVMHSKVTCTHLHHVHSAKAKSSTHSNLHTHTSPTHAYERLIDEGQIFNCYYIALTVLSIITYTYYASNYIL